MTKSNIDTTKDWALSPKKSFNIKVTTYEKKVEEKPVV